MRTPLIRRAQIIKLGRLLDMLYKPSELAEEIGVNVDTIYRSYLPAGAPHTRDKTGAIWIHGPAFKAWMLERNEDGKRVLHPLGEGEAWCVHCNQVVKVMNPRVRHFNGSGELIQGACEKCGRKVNRARKGSK